MNERSILIVGGGLGQLPAIEAATAIGLKVIVVDRNPYAPGMRLGNVALPIDTADIGAIVEVAREHAVDGVLTMQSDVGVLAVGAVVDALSLAGCGSKVAYNCSNKILMREVFARHGVPQPRFAVARSAIETITAAVEIGFPCIVKAPDSSGSRGVVRVEKKTGVVYSFYESMRFTKGGEVLVEEYIAGLEVGAQAYSTGGYCRMVLVHDDVLSNPPFMIPVGHAFPSSLSALQLSKVEDVVRTCVDALGILDGPSNIDLILDPRGNPRIIEVGARIGATCLPELVYHHTGIDWTRAAVQSACGMQPDLTQTRAQPCEHLFWNLFRMV